MQLIKKIKQLAIKRYGSFRKYTKSMHEQGVIKSDYDSNFEKRIRSYIDKLNSWIKPFNKEIDLKDKE